MSWQIAALSGSLALKARLRDAENGYVALTNRTPAHGNLPAVAVEGLFCPGRRPVGRDRVLELAQRHLGLDVVYVTELVGSHHVYRAVAGDCASFHIALDEGRSDTTYCERLLSGTIPNVIPDTGADHRVGRLRITTAARIGAFVGVPLRLPDGTPTGCFCGLRHLPDPTLSERDVRFMSMLAELIIADLAEQQRKEQLRAALLDLIEAEGLEIACQPIVELRSGRCIGLEALSRFPDPFGSPQLTFAAANEVDLGLELERLAVCRAWRVLDSLRPDQFLAVNLSPLVLLELARRAERRYDLPLSSLVVEITEHAVVDFYSELRHALEPLRERGLRLAIDDAGAGYASLHHVLELRPDFIKVDRSLVHGVADDHARRVAVSGLVLLGLDVGDAVVAEGVERPEDLATLLALGVNAGQGYLLGRPSTDPEDLAAWTRALPRRQAG